MVRFSISCLALVLLLGTALLAATPVAAQQTTDTFVLHLVTCPGPDGTVEIRDAFDAEAEGCVDDWAVPSNWTVDGQPAAAINGYAQLFTGMNQGQTYQLDEQSGAYDFDGPYTFTFPETGDYGLYAVLYQSAGGATATPEDAQGATTAVPQKPAADGGATDSVTAIYAGDCAPGAFVDPVAVLNDVAVPTGEPVGTATSSAVATSVTRTDVPLDALLDGGHVLAVFDSDQPDTLIACGMIGGVPDDTGSLAIAITPSQESGIFGVASLTPEVDGVTVSLFLVMPPAVTSATPGT